MLDRSSLLIKVARPVFWPSVALLFIIGVAASGAEFTTILGINMVLMTTLLPLIVFGINDVYDFSSDSINIRKLNLISGGALPKKQHSFVMVAAIVASSFLILFSAYFGNYTNLAATLIVVLIGWSYSANPVRLKEIPIIDSLSNAVLVWAVILAGFSYGKGISSFPASIYFASLGAAAIHSIAAIVDYTPDRKAGVQTIATFFGKRFAANFAAVLFTLILLLSGIKSAALNFIVIYCLAASVVLVAKDDERLAKIFSITGFVIALLMISIFAYQQFFK